MAVASSVPLVRAPEVPSPVALAQLPVAVVLLPVAEAPVELVVAEPVAAGLGNAVAHGARRRRRGVDDSRPEPEPEPVPEAVAHSSPVVLARAAADESAAEVVAGEPAGCPTERAGVAAVRSVAQAQVAAARVAAAPRARPHLHFLRPE